MKEQLGRPTLSSTKKKYTKYSEYLVFRSTLHFKSFRVRTLEKKLYAFRKRQCTDFDGLKLQNCWSGSYITNERLILHEIVKMIGFFLHFFNKETKIRASKSGDTTRFLYLLPKLRLYFNPLLFLVLTFFATHDTWKSCRVCFVLFRNACVGFWSPKVAKRSVG